MTNALTGLSRMGGVQWTAPAALWKDLLAEPDAAAFRRPAILRFETDAFIEELQAVLEHEPDRLREFVARPETWRDPSPQPRPATVPPLYLRKVDAPRLRAIDAARRQPVIVPPGRRPPTLKLFLPAHQRFYLVAGCLVCQEPGMPNRTVDAAQLETTTFVVRRLSERPAPGKSVDEYAFVLGPYGGQWQKLANPQVVANEERHALSPFTYVQEDGRKRRLMTAMVPVGKREEYIGAALTDAGKATVTKDARLALLIAQVIVPYEAIIAIAERAAAVRRTATKDAEKVAAAAALPAEQDQLQMLSWHLLADFGDWLGRYAPGVWAVIENPADESPLADASERALYARLKEAAYSDPTTPSVPSLSFAKALRLMAAPAERAKLRTAKGTYRSTNGAAWPTVAFRVASAETGTLALHPAIGPAGVEHLVEAMLPSQPAAAAPVTPLAAQTPSDPQGTAFYQIRFVFDRPACGPIAPPTVSAPTEAFQLAGFFDTDAPARPLRISLPLDTTPAGLKRYAKNNAFMVSDVLCGQMKRMEGMSLGDLVLSVLPFPFKSGLPSGSDAPCTPGGQICSFSLPIITICALIMMIIMVKLFDLIFQWMPFFRICFPLPGLRAPEVEE